MSGWVRSMPVSMSPTRARAPRLTAYEPVGVAPMARMSHWGTHPARPPPDPVDETPKSAAQAAASLACARVPAGAASTVLTGERARGQSTATPPTKDGIVGVLGCWLTPLLAALPSRPTPYYRARGAPATGRISNRGATISWPPAFFSTSARRSRKRTERAASSRAQASIRTTSDVDLGELLHLPGPRRRLHRERRCRRRVRPRGHRAPSMRGRPCRRPGGPTDWDELAGRATSLPEFFLELAARHLDRRLALFDLALPHRPHHLVAASEKAHRHWMSRTLCARCPERDNQQAGGFNWHGPIVAYLGDTTGGRENDALLSRRSKPGTGSKWTSRTWRASCGGTTAARQMRTTRARGC